MQFEFKGNQEQALEFILRNKKSGLFMPTGCITGDTIVRVNRGRRTKKINVERLYMQYHDRDRINIKYDLSIKTYIRSCLDDRFGLNEMIDVVYNGEKIVYELTLQNKFKICATADHKILTTNGYIELQDLAINDDVICDECVHSKNNVKKEKVRDICIAGLNFHPYARLVRSSHYKNGITYRVSEPRLICEAKINNLSYDEFVNIIRKNSDRARMLIYLDPKIYVVHHIDGNHYNNSPENVVPMTFKNHLVNHGDVYTKNFTINNVLHSRVVSVKEVGLKKTYDISCKEPFHNFVANGIVVHNCGKTIISLLYLKILNKPALVIVPANLKKVWLQENLKFNLDLQISADYRNPAQIVLVSYDWIKNYPDILKEYEVIILDEGHSICDVETIRYKQLNENIKSRDRVVLLAGYPVENRLSEIYVVSLITDVLGKNWFQFLYRYFTVIKKNNRIIKTIPKAGSIDKIINLIKSYVFIADKDKFFDIPIKKENIIVRFNLSEYQKNIISNLVEFRCYKDDKISINCKNELVVFGAIMQIISGFIYERDDKEINPKFFDENPKLELLKSIIKDKNNFLLWFWFDAGYEMLNRYKHQCRLSKIQTDCRGFNLTTYNFAVWFDVPISGGMFLQGIDRIYRIGRTKDVISVVLIPEGTFGDGLLRMLNRKHKLTKKFISELLHARV